MTAISKNAVPRPILKWAGGKRQLLGELIPRISFPSKYCTYHEPFFGGGALFFELARTNCLPSKVRISDSNHALVEVYSEVRQDVSKVIELLQRHREIHCKEHFYEIRSRDPSNSPAYARAARVIYLNKTCFNGLYRVNARGEFNVPFGKYSNPTICDEANLVAVSEALAGVEIEACTFESVLAHADAGDFVYFDPPYHPVSKTSSFTAYAKSGFGVRDQNRLFDLCQKLDACGVWFLLSNSDTDFIRLLYKGYKIETVLAKRSINSNGAGRGAIQEVLISNYK